MGQLGGLVEDAP